MSLPSDLSLRLSSEKDALIAALVARVDELTARLEALEPENQALRAENAALWEKLELPPKRSDNSPIWRRLLLPSRMTLGDLHQAIQAAMGWEDCHLYLFDIAGRE